MNRTTILIMILIVFSLAVSAVSAHDNLTDETGAIDEDIVINIDNSEDNLNASSVSSKTFRDLNNFISNSTSTDIYLPDDYKFSEESDSDYVDGIVISKSINIFGNGHTIDGSSKARIFYLNEYVRINGVNFINGNSNYGSAVYGSNYRVEFCNFSNNYANNDGGALYNASVVNCIFTSNSAYNYGGAIYGGFVTNCTFIENNAYYGGAMYGGSVSNSKFIENYGFNSGGAIYACSANNCIFLDNSAQSHSGAASNCDVSNCLFKNNNANQGGALSGVRSSANMCTFENNSADSGGAIYGCSAINCIFNSNHANQGGAMAAGGSAENCVFNDNYAVNVGGALIGVTALNSNFTGNYANQGGAMYQNSATGCRFISNSAYQGGAFYGTYGETCLFDGNSANQGGAICNGYAVSSTFTNNHAVKGGAMYGGSQEGSAQACRFISNSADEYGGALYSTSVWNSYFEANTANYGGALAMGSSASGSRFVRNVARITGGVKYDSYVGNSEFSGNSPAYTLQVSDYNFLEGFGGDINIKLYDSPDHPVVGENLTVNVYNSKNQLIGTYKPQTGYNWFINYASGKYRATISVDNPLYEIKAVTISINVKKPTSIYVVDVTANYNSGKCLLVNLHDSAGNILKFAKVSININGATKTYTTNDNGQVIFSTNGLAPKVYDVKISYGGSNTYMATSASAKITIKKVSPKLTASGKTFKRSVKTKKYSVTLKDNRNLVLKNIKLTIKVKNKSYSAKTNSNGVANFKITKLTKKGKYKSMVKFGGNAYYNSINKSVVIKVK